MKSFTQPWTVYRIKKMYEKGTLSLDYYLQRPSEQWDRYKKSLWIHTLITNLPKYPIFTKKSDGIYYVLEGKQRIDAFLSYIDGKYSLSKNIPDVEDEDLGETYHVAGKKFDKLPDNLQNMLCNNVINQYTLDGTDEEIESFFDRINNGAALTPQQQAKAKMGRDWALLIKSLAKSNFFYNCDFSKAQKRHSESELAVLSYMMLTDPDYSLVGLSNSLIAKYASSLKKSEGKEELTNQLGTVLDYLDLAADKPDKNIIKRMNLPMLLVTADEAVKKSVDPKIFSQWLKEFENGLAENKLSRYKEYCGQGSVKREKVLGRKNEMLRNFNDYLDTFSLASKKEA